MKKFRSLICAALSLLMLLPMLIACADTAGGEDTTAAPDVATTLGEALPATPETTRDTLPELDYGGEDVHIVYWENANNNEFYVEQTDGTEINDVVYKRNENVQERLGVNFVWNGHCDIRVWWNVRKNKGKFK